MSISPGEVAKQDHRRRLRLLPELLPAKIAPFPGGPAARTPADTPFLSQIS